MIEHTENNMTQYTKMHISRPLSGTQNEGLEAGVGTGGKWEWRLDEGEKQNEEKRWRTKGTKVGTKRKVDVVWGCVLNFQDISTLKQTKKSTIIFN